MLPQLLNMAFLFAGLALFLVAGIGVFWQKWAVLASVPALLLVMSANLDRVESFKASFPTSAVEAKMRELNQTVDDAKEAIRQIRELAVVTAEALIDLRLNSHALLTGGGGTDEYSEQDAFKKRVIEALKRMGLPEEKLNEVARSDRNVVIQFYCYAAYRFGRSALPETRWREFDEAYSKLLTAQAANPLSPDVCQALLDSSQVDTTRFADYMADFRYYVKTGEQRRAEVWAHRVIWGFGGLPQQ